MGDTLYTMGATDTEEYVMAVNVADPQDTSRYYAVRGRVIATTTEGGADSIEEISHKYLGVPYPNFSGKPETRVLVTIEADSILPPRQ